MGVSALRLFSTKGGVTEVSPRLAEEEAEVQGLLRRAEPLLRMSYEAV